MDISITGSVTGDFGLDKTIAELKKIDGKTIEAGLFDGMNEKKAIWNEYGTSRGIPARPFCVLHFTKMKPGMRILSLHSLLKFLKVVQLKISVNGLVSLWS